MFFATAFREWDDPGVAFATSGTWYARSGEAQGARLRGLRFDNHLPTTHLPHKHLIRNHPHARERERLRHIQARGVRLIACGLSQQALDLAQRSGLLALLHGGLQPDLEQALQVALLAVQDDAG